MKIGGFQPLTLLDFPKHTACLIFTVGCNMRCRYCHNAEFVLPEKICQLPAPYFKKSADFFSFLRRRQGLLEGVVISGGEPTLFPDLPQFIQDIKALGFLVKLDTNGTNSVILKELLDQNLLDYVAMDIKAPLEKYAHLTGLQHRESVIKQSIELLKNSDISYEFRTTVIAGYHTKRDLQKIGGLIRGAKAYYLQNFRNAETLDPAFKQYHGFLPEELTMLKESVAPFVKQVMVRG